MYQIFRKKSPNKLHPELCLLLWMLCKVTKWEQYHLSIQWDEKKEKQFADLRLYSTQEAELCKDQKPHLTWDIVHYSLSTCHQYIK